MLQLNRNVRYQKLPEDDTLLQDDRVTGSEMESSEPRPSVLLGTLLKISTIVILICAVFDGAILAYILFNPNKTSIPAKYDLQNLESPSSYVRLERLYRQKPNTVAYPPIHNRGRYFIQVSSKQKNKSYRMWPTLYQSDEAHGLVPNANNYLKVTDEVSTIVQFRTMDFGMENCSLYFDFPATPSTATNITHISSSEGEAATLYVWALEGNKRLNPRLTTWATKPARRNYLGSARVTYGTKVLLSTFQCKSGSYQTFEIGCSSKDCNVTSTDFEWKKDAFYIIQSQTL